MFCRYRRWYRHMEIGIRYWLCCFYISLCVNNSVVFAVFTSEYGTDSPDARPIRFLPSVEVYGLKVIHLKIPECVKILFVRVIIYNYNKRPLVTFKKNTMDVTIDSGSPDSKSKADIIVKGQPIPKCKPKSGRPVTVLPHKRYKQLLNKSKLKKKYQYISKLSGDDYDDLEENNYYY